MKILILGSEGFIGRHLVEYFLNQPVDVYGCDLYEAPSQSYNYSKVSRLSPELDTLFGLTRFDVCINAAGSGSVPYSMTHPVVDFESNTLDTIRLLDAIRRFTPDCKYLHISSAAIYGNPDKLPINECDSKHPLSPYGWHKLMSEQICFEYHGVFKLHTAIVRPFSVYGNGLKKQLLWDLCQRLSKTNTVELFGNGTESRDFIHCDDLAALIGLLVKNAPFNGEVYNAASGEETTIYTIASIFEDYYQGSKKIIFSGEVRPGDPNNWRADIVEISRLGFKVSKPLRESIFSYIKWFESLN